MSGGIGRQSSREVAHEAEDTRAHLASTLEQLRQNLKPENMMEEVVSGARVGASSVADSLAGVARQYPIPAVLIAAGSAFAMRFLAKRGEGGVAQAPRPASSAKHAMDVSRLPGRQPADFDPIARGADLERQARDVYAPTPSHDGDAMENLSRYLPHGRREVRSKLSLLLEEQPLILGVIGLAVGAAIGAALPATETEDHLMGGTAHRLRESASEAARQEVDGLRNVAGEAIDNVRTSATDNLGDFVKDVGDNARTVVDRTGRTFTAPARDV